MRTHAELTDADQGLIRYLSEAVPELMRIHRVPGCNLAVATRGETRWEAGFGLADVDRGLPMTPDTVGRSGSMGKTYTAVAVMQLVERRLLRLDEPVGDVVGFPVDNPHGGEVTVWHLLTHSSGLGSNGAGSQYLRPTPLAELLREEFASGYRDFFGGALPKWTAPVGQAMQYSNTGIALLGLIVAVRNADGLDFSAYVQRHIIDVLAMSSTQLPPVVDDPAVRPDLLERSSMGYTGFGESWQASPPIRLGEYPAGQVLTTPGDHIRLVLAMMGGGAWQGRRVLSEESVRQLLAPTYAYGGRPIQPGEEGGGPSIGLVWMRDAVGTRREFLAHSGAHMWGWMNTFRGYPQLDLAVAVFTNRWDVARYLSNTPTAGLEVQAANLAADFLARSAPVWGDWAARRSYLAGITVASLNHGVLGIPTPTSPEIFDGLTGGGTFGAAAYRAGFDDLADHVPLSLDDVATFLDEDGPCRITKAERDALWPDLGGTGPYPLPYRREAVERL